MSSGAAVLKKLLETDPSWFCQEGPEGDVVVSTRVRLARNLAGRVFPPAAPLEERIVIEEEVKEALMGTDVLKDAVYLDLTDLGDVDRQFLAERHLISHEHASGEGSRGVAITLDERLAAMVNEEDHLRMYALSPGFQVFETWERIDILDDMLGDSLDLAFSPRLGYITSCPTNIGTGMRASVMLHLPGLTVTRQMEKVFNALSKIKLTVRGLYGEHTRAIGHFFQISNQATLGKTEQELLENLKGVVVQMITYERDARSAIRKQNAVAMEDRIWRAYAILRSARMISFEEAAEMLSMVRLGVYMGIIKNVSSSLLHRLFMLAQPAHLQKMHKRSLAPPQRDVARATFFREQLS